MSVGVSLVRAVVQELERQGHDARAVLREVGIKAETIDEAHARVVPPIYDRLQRRALEVSGDPAFGLHMGENAAVGAFSLLGHMATQCQTVKDGLDILFRYYRILADIRAAPYLIEERGRIRVVYEYLRSPDPLCNRVRAEFGLVRLVLIGRAFFGSENPVEEFWFDHPKPTDPKHLAEYDRLFDGLAQFDRPHSGFVGPKAILEGKQMYHDDTIVELLRSEADGLLQDLGDEPTLAGRVRRAIVNHYTEVQPTAEAIARKLGTSERSLRRHLNQEGTPFNEVLRQALADLAKRILADSETTIQEAAFRMGFSEPSSFHRAFKRWTGQTPTQYRSDITK